MVDPGQVLLGKYRIERVLGKGGMGVVVLAHHMQLDQRVAIKFLLPEALDNQQIVDRFLREARAAVKLKSEHVCRVHDVGTMDNGAPYIVMEYLNGIDLGELLIDRGRPDPGEAVDHVLQACQALAEAHALGIVHRDIKPANLFLTRRSDGSPLIKVLDFGIAKAVAPGELDLTHSKAILGTPSYMAPEQMRSSKTVDARADIWAVGAVLYKLLTGRRPFEAGGLPELCIRVATEPLPPMGIPLPPGLEAAIARCLEKDPDHRYRNVAELAVALAPFARSPDQARISIRRATGTLGLPEIPDITAPHGAGRDARARAASTPPAGHARAASSPPVRQPMATPPAGYPRAASNPPTTLDQVAAAARSPSTIRNSVGEMTQLVGRKATPGRRRWILASTAVLVVAGTVGVAMLPGAESPEPEEAPAAAAQTGPAEESIEVVDAGVGVPGESMATETHSDEMTPEETKTPEATPPEAPQAQERPQTRPKTRSKTRPKTRPKTRSKARAQKTTRRRSKPSSKTADVKASAKPRAAKPEAAKPEADTESAPGGVMIYTRRKARKPDSEK